MRRPRAVARAPLGDHAADYEPMNDEDDDAAPAAATSTTAVATAQSRTNSNNNKPNAPKSNWPQLARASRQKVRPSSSASRRPTASERPGNKQDSDRDQEEGAAGSGASKPNGQQQQQQQEEEEEEEKDEEDNDNDAYDDGQEKSLVDRKDDAAGEGDDDEDDDEDAADARRWNQLRQVLSAKARKLGNDTEVLGGMCLRLALGTKQRGVAMAPKRPAATAAAAASSAASTRKQPPGAEQRVKSRIKTLSPRPFSSQSKQEEVEQKQQAEAAAAAKSREEAAAEEAASRPLRDDELVINHQDIVDESFEVGVMFASKPVVQALANPFVGAITNRVGFTLPMFLGFTIMFLSTLVFAFGSTYATLFLARAIQGVGSACTSVAGMSMIAERFPDDAERGNAMAIALGGLALGVVIGPPFGGFMYELFGKPSPFIVLAALALMDGLLQLLVLQPRVSKCQEEGASLCTLVRDPYILVAAGAITFANTGIGILEPALPLWMMDTMQARNWEQGVAFLPAALSYLFSTNLFGNLGLRIGRWRSALLGLIVIGCSLLLIPFATRVEHLILPNGAIGFAIGMVDSTMMPMLGYLVDIRHTSVYGSVYAIGDVAFCASFVFGPALSGTLVELVGFEGLVVATALICFAFAPLLLLLRDPPARALDEAQLQEQRAMRYVNYNHLESPTQEEAKTMVH